MAVSKLRKILRSSQDPKEEYKEVFVYERITPQNKVLCKFEIHSPFRVSGGNGDKGAKNMKLYALIVAGGTGKRMGGETPKQFIEIAGKPV